MTTWANKINERASGAELSVANEPHVVGEFSAGLIFLAEIPLLESPSTVSLTLDTVTATEVTGVPAAGEYKVHYSGTLGGAIEFNVADAGKAVAVSYKGTGSGLFSVDVNRLQTEKVDRDGSIPFTGNVKFASATSTAWGSLYDVVEFAQSAVMGHTAAGAMDIVANGYFNVGGTWQYKADGAAAMYNLGAGSGSHSWYVAPEGAADDALGWALAMSLPEAGRLGVGVTPSAWDATYKTIELGAAGDGLYHRTTTTLGLVQNAYYDGANWKYVSANKAALYEMWSGGAHLFKVAGTGTVGGAITWASALSIWGTGDVTLGSVAGADAGYTLDVGGTARFGHIGVDATPLTTRGAYIVASVSGATTLYGAVIESAPTGTDGTTYSCAVYGRARTFAGSYTTGQTISFYAGAPTKGAGSTITSAYGLFVDEITQGGSNWAVYTNGATPSYFGGNLRIGDAANQGHDSVLQVVQLGPYAAWRANKTGPSGGGSLNWNIKYASGDKYIGASGAASISIQYAGIYLNAFPPGTAGAALSAAGASLSLPYSGAVVLTGSSFALTGGNVLVRGTSALAWNAGYAAIQVGDYTSFAAYTARGLAQVAAGVYINTSGVWTYKSPSTGGAVVVQADSGGTAPGFYVFGAGAGTNGTTATLAQHLAVYAATGNVGIGTSTDAGYKLDVAGDVRIGGNGALIVDRTGGGTGTLVDVLNSAGNSVLEVTNAGLIVAAALGGYSVGSNTVLRARKTGWTAATGTATRSTFATSTVTLPQLAERVKALMDDLISHGMIGA